MTLCRWSQVYFFIQEHFQLPPPFRPIRIRKSAEREGANAVSALWDLKFSLHQHKVNGEQNPSLTVTRKDFRYVHEATQGFLFTSY